MENAANALQMAAGVLIGILLIGLLLFVFRQMSSVENTQRDIEQSQQTSEFNAKFNAFDKSSMYGTDVISVLGMAISNNEIYNQKYTANPDGRYDSNVENTVNIKIKLKTDVNSKVRVYEYKREFIDGKWVGNWIEDESKASIQPLFIKGREYSLEVINNDKTDYDKIWNIAIKGNTAQEKINGKKKTEIDTMGFNDFKSRIFECTDVQYNDTGKIYVMAFEEKGN